MPEATTTRRALAKVPEITVAFWLLKLLSTGMGEAISDYLGGKNVPVAAAIGIFGLAFALWLQFRQPEYKAPYYWFAVMMVAVFGTQAADGIHDGTGLSYGITTPLFAAITALVFLLWYRTEGTLSIHSINTRRRERFYWLAVLATFALGTAAGDLTALELNLGFWPAAALFFVVICIPLVGWYRLRWNPILSFWFAYVLTRPLGASFADGFSKHGNGGLYLGDGFVAGVALVIFIAGVAWLTITGAGVQSRVHPHPAPAPATAPAPAQLAPEPE